MVDMIKERNIYKAWVSIQKLTKHTMNLRFMYFKELLNAHTKNAIHHSFYYIHIWITARLGIILVHCINLLKFWEILKRFSIRLIFKKLVYSIIQTAFIGPFLNFCITYCKVCQLFAFPFVYCNVIIIYRPCYKKKNQKIDHKVLSWYF